MESTWVSMPMIAVTTAIQLFRSSGLMSSMEDPSSSDEDKLSLMVFLSESLLLESLDLLSAVSLTVGAASATAAPEIMTAVAVAAAARLVRNFIEFSSLVKMCVLLGMLMGALVVRYTGQQILR